MLALASILTLTVGFSKLMLRVNPEHHLPPHATASAEPEPPVEASLAVPALLPAVTAEPKQRLAAASASAAEPEHRPLVAALDADAARVPPSPPPRPTGHRCTLGAAQAACHTLTPVWPSVRAAELPCSNPISGPAPPSAVLICKTLVDSAASRLPADTRAAVAPQLQLLRSAVNAAILAHGGGSSSSSPAGGPLPAASGCPLRVTLANFSATVEPWLPTATVAEQSAREGYTLTITAVSGSVTSPQAAEVQLTADSVLGLRHALRTLTSLVAAGHDGNPAALPVLTITDSPRFGYRGLILDTAHHFVSVRALQRTIRLIGRLKYNVLHWHPTDTQSFQLSLPTHPELAERSTVGPESRYNVADVEAVVEASRLEVRIHLLPIAH